MENNTSQEEKIDHTQELFFKKTEEVKNTRELLLFELDAELYAVPVADIELVMKIPPVTSVPNAPLSIVGIFHLRGRVIVVVDALKRMGLKRITSTIPYFLFVVRRNKNYFAVLVDGTRTVLRVPVDEITPLDPMTAAHVPERYVKGKFLFKDKVSGHSRTSSNIMIEPIPASDEKIKEPLFVERPVVVLDLEELLNEEEIRGASGELLVNEFPASQQE